MPCYSPLRAYKTPSGGITFSAKNGYVDLPLDLACGQCVGCRLERSRQWAIRCLHESQLYDDNCSLTLTYDNDHLPDDYSVDVRHFQLFMKRLRKKYQAKKIRFFHCGEYGDKYLRPHYHALLFNHDFEDKVVYSRTSSGHVLYQSKILDDLWEKGAALIGDVTFESAAYAARYIMKKINGDQAENHYQRVHPETGEVVQVRPEYITMSRRPGLGAGWHDKFKSDTYPSDEVVVRGQRMRPPRFYDSRLEEKELESIKAKRAKMGRKHAPNNTKERLRVREELQNIRLKLLPRKLED